MKTKIKTISNFLFSFVFCLLIVILVAQLLYLLERSLTFRKELSIANQSRILSRMFANSAFAAEKFPYQASRIEQSYANIINLKASKSFTFWVKFKNTGSQNWQGNTPLPPLIGGNEISLKASSNKKSFFYHPWWVSENQPTQLKKAVSPEEIGLFKFAIQAPKTNGIYWEKFNLYKGSELIPGGDIEIPVRVYGGESTQINTGEGTQKNTEKNTDEHRNEKIESPSIGSGTKWWQENSSDLSQIQQDLKWQEPAIRVALYFVDSKEKEKYLPIQISAESNQGYELRDKNDYLFLKQTAGEMTEIDFDFNLKRYFVNINGQRFLSTDSYLKFTPQQGLRPPAGAGGLPGGYPTPAGSPAALAAGILNIPSFKNNVFWGAQVNDNKYRGSLEIQYNPNTNRLWIINELPMEEYLKGAAEVADSSPKEFLKAQIIAARTYAMFRKLLPKYTDTPDGSNLFTLVSTQADQVYRGYGFEARSPRTTEAVSETKGIVAFYQEGVAKTYYFAQTDGLTRDCQAARMCKDFTPYLVAKNDPAGLGKTLRGHGVGMPQEGGRQAAQEGANFLQILKYYYPGIELKKMY